MGTVAAPNPQLFIKHMDLTPSTQLKASWMRPEDLGGAGHVASAAANSGEGGSGALLPAGK